MIEFDRLTFSKRPGSEFRFASRNDTLAKTRSILPHASSPVVYPAAKRRSEAVGTSHGRRRCPLVAWRSAPTALWITKGPRGFIQKSVPAPGKVFGWFQRKWPAIKQHVAGQKLKAIENADDVTRQRLQASRMWSCRRRQLLFGRRYFSRANGYELGSAYSVGPYARNTVGDFQTGTPRAQWPDRVRQAGHLRVQSGLVSWSILPTAPNEPSMRHWKSRKHGHLVPQFNRERRYAGLAMIGWRHGS